ncbi:MAG: UDP-glucose/GDP-mannose dehydrogenase family protein [Synergistales bacterium]|nr:UDP-glucose/GDP-mannose dehydrogenase family protein [Synergistales bacterium]
MKVCMVGTGYVGLVTGACLAESGNYVRCVDIDVEKCSALNRGEIPIYEPGLDVMVLRNASQGRLQFTTDISYGVEDADFVFIAVGTPPGPDGSADLSFVMEVARQIGRTLTNPTTVVTKSTVPVGTTEQIRSIIRSELDGRGIDLDFDIAFCPEFLREGSAIDDFMHPDRVVIGVETDRARESLVRLFSPLTGGENSIYSMSIPSAELTKYAANAMLATRISFMNELSRFCDVSGANVDDVKRGMGSDSRIGPRFLNPGIGYGGSCFPKDVKALIDSSNRKGVRMSLLEAVEDINRSQKTLPVRWLKESAGEDLSRLTVAIWGLSFKPETDDMREAPALEIVKELKEAGATIRAFDPVAMDKAKEILGDSVSFGDDCYSILDQADCLIIVTEWLLFREPDFDRVKNLMARPLVLDGRNVYDPKEMEEMGFTYRSVGRPRG